MRLVADLHIHTISSGHAYSTLQEYVEVAKAKSLEMIAVTDHGPAMPGGPFFYHFSNMRMIPRQIEGIRILRGIEANVIDDKGSIDLDEKTLSELDIVMVAMHPRTGYENQEEEKNTQVLIKALENPYINIIAHPGNPYYPINAEKTVAAAKEKGVIIEVNNSSFTGSRIGSWERCLEFAKEVKKQNWKVIIGSDAHIWSMLGTFEKALELVKLAGLTEEQVVNSSVQNIEKYLLNRPSPPTPLPQGEGRR